jgi:chromosomal replication initiation ATPase DnaA
MDPILDLTPDEVVEAGSRLFEIPVEDLRGPSTTRRLVAARHLIMYVARFSADASYPQIGAALDRDHATAMNGVRRIAARIDDPRVARRVKALTDAVGVQP